MTTPIIDIFTTNITISIDHPITISLVSPHAVIAISPYTVTIVSPKAVIIVHCITISGDRRFNKLDDRCVIRVYRNHMVMIAWVPLALRADIYSDRFLSAAALNVGSLIWMITWQPTADDIYEVFVLLGLWGVAEGIWQSQINSKHFN